MAPKRKRGKATRTKRKLWKDARLDAELASFFETQYSEDGELEEEVFGEIPRDHELLGEFLALLNGPVQTDFEELKKIMDEDEMDYDDAEGKLLRIESILKGLGAKKLSSSVFVCLLSFADKRRSFSCLAHVKTLERELSKYKKVLEQLIMLEQKIMEEGGQKLGQQKQQQEASTIPSASETKKVVSKEKEGQGGKGTQALPSNPEKKYDYVLSYSLPSQFDEIHQKQKKEVELYCKPYAKYCQNMVRKRLVNKVFCKTMEMRAHERRCQHWAKFIDENIQHIEEKIAELQNILWGHADSNTEHDEGLCLVNRLYLISTGLGLGNVKSNCDDLRYLIKSRDLAGSKEQLQLLKRNFQDFQQSYLEMIKGLRDSRPLGKGEVTLRVGNGAKVVALAMEKEMEDNNVFVPRWPENGVWRIPKVGRLMNITYAPRDFFEDEIVDS